MLDLLILRLSCFLFLFNSILVFAGNLDEIADDVCPLFDNNLEPKTRKLSLLAFGPVYTVVNVMIFVMVLLNVVVYKLRQLQDANSAGDNLNELFSLRHCRRFSLAEILLATNHFDDSLFLGEGGFGKVYKGFIDNGGRTVAIKRCRLSRQGSPEFKTEIEMLTSFRHCNIISLIGYCNSFDEMIIVYEYMANGNLAGQLGRNVNNCFASWVKRLNICIAMARALNYLQTGTSVHEIVIHRDVKSTNILLDENWIAKISDFGLSKIAPKGGHVSTGIREKFGYDYQDGVSTRLVGTFGYLDPDYFVTHRITNKTDVYSFGVVLFEVLCGRPAVDSTLQEEERGLAAWAAHCISKGMIDQIIDPNLKGQILPNCLSAFVQIANQCVHRAPKKRPTMAEVVVQLQLVLALQERGDSSTLEEEVFTSGRTKDRKELAYSHIPREVKNTKHLDKKIDGFINMRDTNNMQAFVKPTKRIKVTQKARVFFSVTARSISGKFRQVRLSEQTVTTNLKRFKFAELKMATRNFSPDLKLSKGYFQTVFIGWLNEKAYTPSKIGVGMAVAVKKFNVNNPQNFEAWKILQVIGFEPSRSLAYICFPFVLCSMDVVVCAWSAPLVRFGSPSVTGVHSEVQLFGKFNHPNLVKLLGYCWEDKGLFIVYEYMQKGSLDKHLFKEGGNPFSWDTRLKISIGAARGLCFLHKTESGVIHRKVKTSNILLDGDFNAKLSDFGLAKSGSLEEHTGLTASIAGAYGFLAPEYIATGCWYAKSDVYSFGAVLLELLTGRHVRDEFWQNEEDADDLVEWARVFLPNKTELKNLIDPRLKNDYPLEEAFELASLILVCLETFPRDRPTIEQVLVSLEQINCVNVKHKEKSEAVQIDIPESSGTTPTEE
ncbi:hypothetical protein LguiB_026128 [Lonicera macranthoides]